MRVRDWQRWNRTKQQATALLLLAFTVSIGGLEGEGPIPYPNAAWATGLATLACFYAAVRRPRA